ncbi:MAG TPA: choice-of-anchor tandem repeat GloVer-containing protein, partial [Verrucomicrobiae bacterium]
MNGIAQNSLQIIHGQKPAATDKLKPQGRYASTNHLDLALGLPLRDHAGLSALLRDLYDPASPSYHKYITSRQFAERFGPSVGDYRKLADFATGHGLKIMGTHDNRTLLDVSGSAGDIEKAFHVRMQVYQHPTECRTFHAPDGDPSIDLDLPVLGVYGLDNYVVPRPMNLKSAFDSTNAPTFASGSGPGGNYIGYDFRAAYAPGVSLTGAGQTVGLLEFDGYYPSDIAQYLSVAKLPNVPITNILVDGFSGAPGPNEIEVVLDIDMAICMAPGMSQMIVYEGLGQHPDDVLNRMATDNLARQLSSSWGFGSAVDPNREQIYEQYAAQGQTMFQASGDSGAYSSGAFPPSDDPNVTVVGGTLLSTSGPGGPWAGETAWSDSGGGSSVVFPIPTWQAGVSTPQNGGSSTFRNIPDIAAISDVSIWLVAFNGEQGAVGGTSAAAPIWVGFAALANQQAAEESKPPLGFINPTIYAIGRSASYMSAFHDVTTGNNTNGLSPTNFFAGPGYDLCTGWGTPNGSNLINALLAPPDAVQIFPPGGLTSEGGAGGPFSPPSQGVTLTNIGATNLNWAAGSVAPWLTVSPAAGTLSPGGSAAVVTLSLNSVASNLPPGNYTTAVWFTNLSDGFAQNRKFVLNVTLTSSAPAIVSQPQSQTALVGATAVFTVEAVGNVPLFYQWQKDFTNLTDGANISGSTTATLTLSDVSAASAGTYSVIVSNALNSVTSDGAVLTVDSGTASGVLMSNLYSFTGENDGANPNGLMVATNGNIYGTTQSGGIDFSGTVFQMTPGGVLTRLHLFDNLGTNGFSPQAGLVQGPNGNLYGTTGEGGVRGWGTIFQITTNGVLTPVYSFDRGDGAFPDQPMILNTDGNLYGTTSSGGADFNGEIFKLTPSGALTQLASFNGVNGFNPSKLLEGQDGSLYGTTFDGGANGDGNIFNLATNGTLTTLYSFTYTNGGFLPDAGLVQSPEGIFYGTTFEGGTFGAGTLYEMSAFFAVTDIYSFTSGSDGSHPSA